MSLTATQRSLPSFGPLFFRITLLAAALTLMVFIPFKYATQLHTISGIYAFIFPLSSILALAGIALAFKPRMSCDCSKMTRFGFGGVAVVWLANGLLCVPSLENLIAQNPWGGTIATIHMSVQHIFLSLVIIAFAVVPYWMTRKFGGTTADLANASTLESKSIPT